MFSSLGYTIFRLWICKKRFYLHHFPYYPSSSMKCDKFCSCNNLFSFCYWHYNHVLHIGIHDLDSLDLQEKLFFPPFSLKLMFICEKRQTWILIIISILFVIGMTIMFSSLGYMILKLWICKKSFLSTIFLLIKVHL